MSEPVRVLLVEDSEDDADLLLWSLSRGGMDARIHRIDSEAGLRAALVQGGWQAVVSDYNLPGFDGLEALRIVRETGLDIPFILISGAVGEEIAVDAMKSGAADYVMKSNLARLPLALTRELEEVQTRTAHREAQAAIRENERRYRQLVHALPAAIYTCEADGLVSLYNDAAVALWGRRPTPGVTRWIGAPKIFDVEGRPVPPEESAMARAMREKRAILGSEIQVERPDGTRINVLSHPQPMFDASGTMIGGVNMLIDISERKRAERELRRLNRVYAVLSSINSAIVRTGDREALLRDACQIAVEVGGFAVARVICLDDRGRAYLAATTESDPSQYQPLLDEFNDDPAGARSLLAEVLRTGEPMVSNDVSFDPRVPSRALLTRDGTYALAILPLRVEDRIEGAFALRAKDPGMFDEAELKMLLELVSDMSLALAHIARAERLNYLALNDRLTGLANRHLLLERLARTLEGAGASGGKISVALLDVERLRSINESFGRDAGDGVIRDLAARLKLHDAADLVARVDGNQFVVVFDSVKGRSEAARQVEHLWSNCFSEPLQVAGSEFRIAARVGVTVFPNDGADAEVLLRNAEAALESAKLLGERTVFYTPALTERTAELLRLENQLRQALERSEFVLHYQPKVSSATGRVVGVEALIRWQSPALGLVPPNDFIPLMERTGLILEAGAWALRQAVADHARWRALGMDAPRVAVNVSSIQLRRRDFVDGIRAILRDGAESGVDLEITESLVMEDIEQNMRKLQAVRALGVAIAIDDFGTGYSSLGYLAKLPVQSLKIDRSFVITMLGDPATMTLVEMIISLAHSLRLEVVAEGVDDAAQAEVLRRLGCDQMQGYLFSRPVPFEQLSLLLQAPLLPAQA